MITALIPLENSQTYGSVSSSYMDLKGAIALSHSEDPLLQAETLIHEFCHQKMNQLLIADPILLPGQSGQVFYSPWRPDARRLRGLLLGAHAFLKVGRYLARSLAREARPEADEIEIMVNVARRVHQVDAAMNALTGYGSFTEFGRRFVLGMWRELTLLKHAVMWFPPALLAEQRAACEEHRRRFALFDTGFYRGADFVDGVPRAAFQAPKP
jgi:HEXXH motif-containing protein